MRGINGSFLVVLRRKNQYRHLLPGGEMIEEVTGKFCRAYSDVAAVGRLLKHTPFQSHRI